MSLTATKDQVLERVIAVIALALPESFPLSSITAETAWESLPVDSLDFVDIMQSLDIQQESWPEVKTVGDMVRVLMTPAIPSEAR